VSESSETRRDESRGSAGGGGARPGRSRRGRGPGLRRLAALASVCVAVALVVTFVTTGSQRAPAATPETATMLTVYDGHGWGHGIGLSQWGTYGYATKTSLTYRQILRHYYTGIDFGSAPNGWVRVLLNDDRASVYVRSSAAFTLTNGVRTKRIPGGRQARITWNAVKGVSHVTWGSGSTDFSGDLTARPGTRRLQLLNKNQNGSSAVQYRGSLLVYHLDAGYTIVNRLRLESYLYGVVPHESPSWWPARALRVQAVAARSYAVASLKSGGLYDVACTTASQVYDGVDGRGGEQPASTSAVDVTRGVIATYGGQVITAFFFSTSGGRTANIEDVWTSASPVPYLKSVDDPKETQDAAGRTGSPYHDWPQPLRFTEAQVRTALGLSDPVTAVVATTKDSQGERVIEALVVQGDSGVPITGDSLRSKLALRSTWFSLRTVSITPAGSTPATIAPDGTVTLSGAVYPGLGTGETATLHYRRAGESVWHARTVTTTPGTTTIGDQTVDFSTWSFVASPPSTTTYYLSMGPAVSPQTTVTVTP
jgi:SpoIID/LytB domain protein